MKIDEMKCPYCGKHPMSYVDTGNGIIKPLAVTCCEQASLLIYNTLVKVDPANTSISATELLNSTQVKGKT
jgi:hypothetical protein